MINPHHETSAYDISEYIIKRRWVRATRLHIIHSDIILRYICKFGIEDGGVKLNNLRYD